MRKVKESIINFYDSLILKSYFFTFKVINFLFHFLNVFLMESNFKSLLVYKLSYEMAMEIFELTKSFPKEETYSIVDQIRRSSRSICANFGEGYRKRIYPKYFIKKLTDSDGECSETSIWIDFSKDCNYISEEQHRKLMKTCNRIGGLLGYMIKNPDRYSNKKTITNSNQTNSHQVPPNKNLNHGESPTPS